MPESIINNQTEENLKKYLGNKGAANEPNGQDNFFSADKKESKKKKNLIFFVLIFFAILSAVAYYSFMKGQNSFDEKKVILGLVSKGDIQSGEEVAMEINYRNDNEVDLADATLAMNFPSGFIFSSSDPKPQGEKPILSWKLGKLNQGKLGKIRLFGKLIGKIDSENKFSLQMSYKPSNINYEYKSESESTVKISSIPFEFSIKSKESVNNGDEIQYDLHYKNASSRKFSRIELRSLPIDGFEYKSSDPPADLKDKALVWRIDNVAPNSEGNIVLRGSLRGEKDEEKKLNAVISAEENGELFDYADAESKVKIGLVPIVISQTVNGESNLSADKNSELEYKIKFKNIGDAPIKGLVINDELEGNIDYSSIKVSNGTFDGKNKITWSAFNVPRLASLEAGDEEEVSFKLKVNDIFPIGEPGAKNFVIKSNASIKNFNVTSDSPEIGKTIASSLNEVKIKSFMVLKQTAYYNDDQRIPNTGFIPPEVGEETTYTVHWNLSNLFNNTSNLVVTTKLSENARWTGSYITSDGRISKGDETNGVNSASIDPLTISDINGGLLENGFGISYIWDKRIQGDKKFEGLPQGFAAGDELTFTYNDGSIKESANCTITEYSQYVGSYYCQVPWQVGLSAYAERAVYKIGKTLKMDKEDFYYNPVTREVAWFIPKAEANMGIVSPAKEVVFQIGITPQEGDAGRTVSVVDKAVISGYDEFSRIEVSNADAGVSSDLPDDESIGLEEGIVVSPENGEEMGI